MPYTNEAVGCGATEPHRIHFLRYNDQTTRAATSYQPVECLGTQPPTEAVIGDTELNIRVGGESTADVTMLLAAQDQWNRRRNLADRDGIIARYAAGAIAAAVEGTVSVSPSRLGASLES